MKHMKMNNNYRKNWIVLTLLLVAIGVSAQDGAPSSDPSYQITLATIIYVFGFILLMIALAVWQIARHLKRFMRKEFTQLVKPSDGRNWWERTFQLKSVSTDKDTMINHPHDGIYELDNPPPPWFMILFYFTIVVAVIYYVRFTFTDSGYTQIDEYEQSMAAAEGDQQSRLETAGSSVDENTVVYLTDPESLEKGKAIYDGNCKICHGDYGQGAIGPNFTDDYFLHGGDVKDIFKVIKYGVVEKGMISWESQLGPESIQKVTSYIKSLQGTVSPIPGKEAQGELYVEEAPPAPTDSSANVE
jgi:cytochrome c oxidase cbb3-type subunit III